MELLGMALLGMAGCFRYFWHKETFSSQSGVALRFPPHSIQSPFVHRLIFIEYLETIRWESIDGIDLCGSRRSLEPTGRTPWIGVGSERQPMLHGILMHIIQACKVGFFMGEARLPEIVPDFPARCLVEMVHPLRHALVKFAQHGRDRCGVGRRVADEVIVIRENRPGFQAPLELVGDG